MTAGNVLPASACGFHKPQDLFYGAMALSYPQSLSVFEAVTTASHDGLIPSREIPHTRDFFAYHRTARQLHEFPQLLTPMVDEGKGPSFSLVLIDTMLWTRFEQTDSGYAVKVHVEQPSYDAPVVVTHGEVLAALVDGKLELKRALLRGLVRTYGPEGREGEFLQVGPQSPVSGMNSKNG
jgi:hypothetical protein